MIRKLVFISLAISLNAPAASIWDLENKVVAQGVPQDAVERLFHFLQVNLGKAFTVPTYRCLKHPDSVKPCKMKERVLAAQKVTVPRQRYSVIVDYTKDSLEKRFYVIDMHSGIVRKFLAAHGKGSGDGLFAWRFGDRTNSKETALGMYLSGPVYRGAHGLTLRMYGLQKSNSNAYWRDIVLHGAWYMRRDFAFKTNPKTGEPFDRLGVSWGCPALDPEVAKQVIPLIENGALIYHYQRDLADRPLTGDEVRLAEPIPLPRPRPHSLTQIGFN